MEYKIDTASSLSSYRIQASLQYPNPSSFGLRSFSDFNNSNLSKTQLTCAIDFNKNDVSKKEVKEGGSTSCFGFSCIQSDLENRDQERMEIDPKECFKNIKTIPEVTCEKSNTNFNSNNLNNGVLLSEELVGREIERLNLAEDDSEIGSTLTLDSVSSKTTTTNLSLLDESWIGKLINMPHSRNAELSRDKRLNKNSLANKQKQRKYGSLIFSVIKKLKGKGLIQSNEVSDRTYFTVLNRYISIRETRAVVENGNYKNIKTYKILLKFIKCLPKLENLQYFIYSPMFENLESINDCFVVKMLLEIYFDFYKHYDLIANIEYKRVISTTRLFYSRLSEFQFSQINLMSKENLYDIFLHSSKLTRKQLFDFFEKEERKLFLLNEGLSNSDFVL